MSSQLLIIFSPRDLHSRHLQWVSLGEHYRQCLAWKLALHSYQIRGQHCKETHLNGREGEYDMFNISLNRYCLEVSSNQLLFDLQIFQRHDRSAPKEFHQNSISLECWVVPAANLCPAVYIRTCLLYKSLSFTH